MNERIRNRLNAHIEYLLSKDILTPEDYAILSMELDKRKHQSMKESEDTIMRIFANIN